MTRADAASAAFLDYRDARVLRVVGADVPVIVRAHASDAPRPRCMLIHGNPGSLLDWSRLLPLLTGFADVAALDCPGFGRSARTQHDRATLSLDYLADAAVAVTDALGWREPSWWVGHSHGGGVAQTIAARHPERVAGIVLLGTLGAPTHSSYRWLARPGMQTAMRGAGVLLGWRQLRPLHLRIAGAIMGGIYKPQATAAERVAREIDFFSAHPQVLQSMVQVARGKPCDQLLQSAERIRCPVLFVHGEDDTLVPVACARSIHERILSSRGRSELVVLPRAGHMLIHDPAAATVAEHIARFIGAH